MSPRLRDRWRGAAGDHAPDVSLAIDSEHGQVDACGELLTVFIELTVPVGQVAAAAEPDAVEREAIAAPKDRHGYPLGQHIHDSQGDHRPAATATQLLVER